MRIRPFALSAALFILAAPAAATTSSCTEEDFGNGSLSTGGLVKNVEQGFWGPAFVSFDGDCTILSVSSLGGLTPLYTDAVNNDAELLYTAFSDGNHFFTHDTSVPIHAIPGTFPLFGNVIFCNARVCLGTSVLPNANGVRGS